MEMTSKVRETWEQEVTVLKDEIVKLGNILEAAWGVIANAGGGDWEKETKEWQEAAARWRDNYHKTLSNRMQNKILFSIEKFIDAD